MPTYTLNVNGVDRTVNVSSAEMPLLWVLRDVLNLTGTKYGCGIEVCSACTVMMDGQPEKSCKVDISSAAGKRVVTIEGLSPNRSHPAQQAWICAMQAGHHGKEIESELNNLCVCGTYQRVKRAVAEL
jgi:isoquinoline 1-oxidoreductase alpha subunit